MDDLADINRKRAAIRRRREAIEDARWKPRGYQEPFFRYMRDGGTRAVLVWHRRAGKDTVALQWTVEEALRRVGVYWHMLPTSVQGRKVVWDGRTKGGEKFLDAWGPPKGSPGSRIRHIRNDEMSITLEHPDDPDKPGSIWQVVGSDNYDALVGSNPIGVVFSEYAVSDPRAWDFIRPILAENGGWAVFPYTPRGHNHGLALYEIGLKTDAWYCELKTVEDTGAIPLEAVEDERQAGMSEDMIQQEFYCSFEASLIGAYYADQMAVALEEGRLNRVPHDPGVSVDTFWDLGIGDAMCIGFVQNVGQERRIINYYETSGEPLSHYASLLQRYGVDYDYVYGTHHLPHDGVHRELGTGKTRQETLSELGIQTEIVPLARFEAGIDATRNMFPKLWIDEKCERLINGLRQYRKEYDEDRGIYKDRPRHDWCSHPADMVRYMAMTPVGYGNWGRELELPKLAIV